MFERAFVDRERTPNKKWAMLGSVLLQVGMLATALMIPLLFVDELPPVLTAGVFLAPPQPPGPPPPPPVTRIRTQVVPEFSGFFEPTTIPREVAIIVEEAPPSVTLGNYDGVIGGDPDGVRDGVISGIVSRSLRTPAPPPPPAPKPQVVKPATIERVRIGGDVRPPVLIKRINPAYPRIAKQAGITGTVKIEAVIGVDGRIASARVVSGHPLLMKAALDAVRQWVYRPTLLNGNPVEVVMQVSVNFTLGR